MVRNVRRSYISFDNVNRKLPKNDLQHSSATWVNIHPGVNLVEIRGEMEFWGKSVTKVDF